MAEKTKYTPALIEAMCERLSKGEPLAQICRGKGMPAYRTVWDWMQQREDVAKAIARAREMGEDALAEECLEIADDATNDWMERYGKDGESLGPQLNAEHVQRSKLRIETRLKLLSKWNPKKYGDRITHAGDEDSPIRIMDDTKLESRLSQLLGKAGIGPAPGGEGAPEG